MTILSWNCRGLGNPQTVRVLLDLVQSNKPMIIFLMETMIKFTKLDQVRRRLGFKGLFMVEGEGHGGGLALLWKETSMVTIISSSLNYINAKVQLEGIPVWRLTGFYGFPERSRRRLSWDLLRSLYQNPSSPWCVVGNFNDILHPCEKSGGVRQASWLIDGFQTAVSECGLSELSMIGYPFT